MHLLAAVDICTEDYEPLWNIVGLVINIIKIGIPIVLIVLGMIDFAKATIAGKEDEQKKATKLLGKRFLYAIGVFASVWIVTFVLDLAADMFGKNNENYDYNEESWMKCWNLINGGTNTNSENAEEKKCYKCNYNIGSFYKFVLPEYAGTCEEQSKFTTEEKCLANNKGACYLCGEDNADGLPGYYEWRDAPVAGCKKTSKSMEECEKAIKSSSGTTSDKNTTTNNSNSAEKNNSVKKEKTDKNQGRTEEIQ